MIIFSGITSLYGHLEKPRVSVYSLRCNIFIPEEIKASKNRIAPVPDGAADCNKQGKMHKIYAARTRHMQ